MRRIGRTTVGLVVGVAGGLIAHVMLSTSIAGMLCAVSLASLSLGTVAFFSCNEAANAMKKVILYFPITMIFSLFNAFLLATFVIHVHTGGRPDERMYVITAIAWLLGSIEYYLFVMAFENEEGPAR